MTSNKEKNELLEHIWEDLQNQSFDQDDLLEKDWYYEGKLLFRKGNHRIENIWRWFDQQHSKGLRYLLFEYNSLIRQKSILKSGRYHFGLILNSIQIFPPTKIDADKLSQRFLRLEKKLKKIFPTIKTIGTEECEKIFTKFTQVAIWQYGVLTISLFYDLNKVESSKDSYIIITYSEGIALSRLSKIQAYISDLSPTLVHNTLSNNFKHIITIFDISKL